MLFCGVQKPAQRWHGPMTTSSWSASSNRGRRGPTFDQLYAWWSSHS
jgi:hypothetical protein